MPATPPASGYPLLRLVDGPSVDATVRLDLNQPNPAVPDESSRHILADGWDFGTPDLQGDVDAIDPIYGSREIRARLRIVDNKPLALAMQARLARELLRASGWLHCQLSPSTPPIWWRLYRAQPDAIEMTHVSSENPSLDDETRDVWTLDLRLPAEAFAWGERVTLVDDVEVSNNPTDPGGCHLVLNGDTAVPGDAPTALQIQTTFDEGITGVGRGWMHIVHAAPTARPPVLVDIGDGMVAGPDTSGSATGGADDVGGKYRTVTFATNEDLVTRLTFGLPADVVALPGRYKVLLRTWQAIGHPYSFRLTFQSARTPITVTPEVDDTTVGHRWIDLGEIGLPPNPPPASAGVLTIPDVYNVAQLQVGAPKAVQDLRLDALLFVPIGDDDTAAVSVLHTALPLFGLGDTAVWDGDLERCWSTLDDEWIPIVAEHAGMFVHAVPGQANTLTLLREVDSPHPVDDPLATSTRLTITCHPRHLYLGGL